MLSFATEFPVSPDGVETIFVDTVRRWVLDSPYTVFSEADLAHFCLDGEFNTKLNGQFLSSVYIRQSEEVVLGTQLITIDKDIEWNTSIVLSKNSDDCWIGIRTSREAVSPAVNLPQAKKPVVVRSILGVLSGSLDGYFEVQDKPHFLTNNDIILASRIISGDTGSRLPIVYISVSYNGRLLVDAGSLAQKLSGMAHVVVEPNRPFSQRLQIEVNSSNVYGGALGVYWPDAAARKMVIIPTDYDRVSELRDDIFESIRSALLNRQPLYRCTWAAVREALSRKIIEDLKSSGSKEINDYIEQFDQEQLSIKQNLSDAEREIARLRSEIKKYNAISAPGAGISIKNVAEQELYPGEIFDVIIESLEDAINNTVPNSRKLHILNSLVKSNSVSSHRGDDRSRLKAVLRDYKRMDGKTRSDLLDLGFSITEDGKHYKLIYKNDPRYTFALSKTGSDVRGGLNSASDIAKRLF